MTVAAAGRFRERIIVSFLVVASCVMLGGARARAQSDTSLIVGHSAHWGMVDAMGFGGLGTLVGTAVAFSQSYSTITPPPSWFVSVGTGAVVGLLAGAAIGGNAQHAINRGRPLNPAHRGLVKFGAVMAGATVGALAAVPVISGSLFQADEAVFAGLTVGGAALGAMYVGRHDEELQSYRFTVSPAYAPNAGYGARVALEF